MKRSRLVMLGALLPLAACTSGTEAPTAAPEQARSSAAPSPSASSTPTRSPAPTPSAGPTLPPVGGAVSLPALMRETFRGSRIRAVRLLLRTDAYTRSEVTYRSGDVTVSGVLLRPRGRGPFPAVVLNHGYIDPASYVTGQGLAREQDYLARHGYVVLHTDYRGHAASDPASPLSRETRLGYTRDTINAVKSVQRLSYVDRDRLAMLGRSMGGGVTMNALVAQPGLVDAAVIYDSVSSSFLDNLRRWTIPERPAAARALFDRFGTPRQSPGFYRGLSARTYFGRITEPVLSMHGSVDRTCPPRWARTTQRLMKRAGVDSRLVFYAGEDHAFYARWQDSIERAVRFLDRHLRA